MNVVDTHNTVNLSLPIATHVYKGDEDNCNFRNGRGDELWTKESLQQQSYSGNYLDDCLHGIATYKWIANKQKYVYEGRFYANNLEGYGLLSYPDGKVYEGLFKFNERYGPGIVTYPDGQQDVGLWSGLQLVRLNYSLQGNYVPVLAKTSRGKIYLLQYKNLVPIINQPDQAEGILTQLEASNKVLEDHNMLYSKYVRNPSSTFFNKTLFYEKYFTDNVDYTVSVVESYHNGHPKTKKVIVTDLLAWNNEDIAMSIMKHTFLHRNYENSLSYRVVDLLAGKRHIFRELGPHEIHCKKLLEACTGSKDDEGVIVSLICEHDLYPDVTDSLGNSGITFASSLDKIHVIKALVDYGVNIDHLNDECLTPLLICLLRYVATKYDVLDWEVGFLPQTNLTTYDPKTQEWRANPQKSVNIDNKVRDQQKYILDLSCVHPPLKQKAKGKGKTSNSAKNSAKKSKNLPCVFNYEDPKKGKLQTIFNTLLVLLQYGADTNFGEVPLPPLFLSLFTRCMDIVSGLIDFGANCNIRTSYPDGSLTPLHVVASLQPEPELLSMAKVLLNNGADPNLTANTIHWLDEKIFLLAGTEVNDTGKTPLHLLCIRWDFEDDVEGNLGGLCKLFIESGADPNMFYLGHTPLSLAIVRGNSTLIKHILGSGLVDPNQVLENGMGVPLTVLILKRYEGIQPLNVCRNVYNTLLHFNANPLNDVPNFIGNTVEFTIKGNTQEDPVKGKKGKGKKKKGSHKHVIQILSDCAGKTLLRNIHAQVVKIIYEYKIECSFEDEIFDDVVKFIDFSETATTLQILIHHGQINANKMFCYELLTFVRDACQKNDKKKKSKKNKKKNAMLTPDEILDKLDFKKQFVDKKEKKPFYAPMPEVDANNDKYVVCFECYQKTNKELILCPKCELVYFCSQKCNITNNKKKTTRHPCKILFYDSERKRMLEALARGEPLGQRRLAVFKAEREEMMKDMEAFEKMLKCKEEKIGNIRALELAERIKLKGDKGKDKNEGGLGTLDKDKEESARSKDTKSGKDEKNKKNKKEKKERKRGRSKSRDKSKGRKEERGRSRSQTLGRKDRREDGRRSQSLGARKLGDRFSPDQMNLLTFADICRDLDPYKFNQMFLPFVVFTDGQLYYRFEGLNTFYKLTYSSV